MACLTTYCLSLLFLYPGPAAAAGKEENIISKNSLKSKEDFFRKIKVKVKIKSFFFKKKKN
jgi:hypothetical protein